MSEMLDDDRSTIDALATVLSGGALVSASKVVSLGFGFFTQLVMARLLTEAAYGQVVLTLAVVSIAGLVARLGLDDGVTRELSHYEDEPAAARGVIRAGIGIGTVSSLIIAIGVFLAAPVLAVRIFDSPSLVSLVRIAAVGIPFTVLTQIAISLARGTRDASVEAYVGQIFKPAARLILIAVIVIAGFGAIGAITGQIVANILGGILALWLAWRRLPSFKVSPERMYRSVFLFSLPLIIVQGMGFLNSNIDTYMIGYFMSSSKVGSYNIAFQLGNLITAIPITMGFLLSPVLTRLHKRENDKEKKRVYQIITKWIVIFSFPIFVILFLFPQIIIRTLFGGGYIEAGTALRILVLGNFAANIFGMNGEALISLGGNQTIAYITSVQTIINVMLNYFLIPLFGLNGAAIAVVLGQFFGDMIGTIILQKDYDVHPFTNQLIKFMISIILISVISFGLISYFSISLIFILIPIGLCYLVLIILSIETEDKTIFKLLRAELN